MFGNDAALDGHVKHLIGASPKDCKRHVGSNWATHQADSFFKRFAAHRLAIDVRDQVLRLKASFRPRGSVNRRDDKHDTVFHGYLDANTTKCPLELVGKVFKRIDCEKAAVGIKTLQHALNCGLD